MISKESDKKLFLLDAYALIFRAYYAFIRNPRINSKGLNTSAMFGFTNVLMDVIHNEKPSHLAVVFDPPEGNFRTEVYTEYKANRDETPEDIKLSVPYLHKIIQGFGVPIIMVPRYEADDVVGHIAKIAEKEGFLTYMMTSDKDYAQLVSENILMFRPGRSGKPAEIWDVEAVKERFEVEDPMQVIDILGLQGDAVDNIPGIPGIGEKTAKKLIGKYGSVENLIANSHELKGKQKENVENFAEQGLLSKKLATIVTDIDYQPNFEEMVMTPMDKDLLREVFMDLEFRTLSKRVLGEDLGAPEGEQISLFGDNDIAVAPEKEEPTFKTIENTPHHYQLVDSEAGIQELLKELEAADEYCFDTETSALNPMDAKIVGMAFSTKPGTGYYVPTSGPEDPVIQQFTQIFEDENKLLIGQNLKYDLKIIHQSGIHPKNKMFDTMIAHYLMNPDLKHGMDVLAETFLDYKPVSIETLIGKKGKNQRSMADLEPAAIADYASEDADITLKLKHAFQEDMQKDHLKKLFEEVEIPLMQVLGEMELEGVNINKQVLLDYSVQLGEEISQLEGEIHELAGETFNVDSPKQLGPILFEKLAISAKAKKTKTGQYSTSEDVLSKHVNDHKIVPKLLRYRQLKKLKSTYVDPLPDLVNDRTNRLHTSYMQTVAATGRLSSNNPNLQNIPIRTAEGRYIRKAFVPRDENHVLLAADYSQVELRIIAALSEDDGMCEAFIAGADIHAATAAKVFGVPLEEVDREMRSKAKAVNFGIIYGQGAFGLAQNLGISRKESKGIIDEYYRQFSRLKAYQGENIEFARKHGYVETILGRRRYLPDIQSSNAVVRGFAERNAINAPIQGSAADVIKVAMVNIQRIFKERGFKSKMIMQVHDELVFDAHKDELDIIKPIIVEEMEGAVSLRVPLKVEMDLGQNWLEAH